MKKRLALFDLGTNTFNLLVCDVANGEFTKIYDTKIPVKLGEGGLANNKLLPQAMERGIMALRNTMYEVTQLGCDSILAIGTAALRSADNAQDFINQVKTELKIDIDIIDGAREAELIYKGVKHSHMLTDDLDLIMDIGGGSIEFIIGNNHEVKKLFSFNAGVAKLLRIFNPEDPITAENIKAIHDYLDNEFEPLKEAISEFKPKRLIGSSGSFDSVRDMIMAAEHLHQRINNQHVSFELFNEIHKTVSTSSKDQRFEVPGLISMRVDYIVIAVVLMKYVMTSFKFEGFTQCDYSLKEGLLSENLH